MASAYEVKTLSIFNLCIIVTYDIFYYIIYYYIIDMRRLLSHQSDSYDTTLQPAEAPSRIIGYTSGGWVTGFASLL